VIEPFYIGVYVGGAEPEGYGYVMMSKDRNAGRRGCGGFAFPTRVCGIE
jgi:hypothetical protein